MEVSLRCEPVLELGRRLIKELGLDQSVDTLARWMAHYVAELIYDAEHAPPEDRADRMNQCKDVVLSLWEHRYALPKGMRPYDDLESVLRALASLDPEASTSRYFRPIRMAMNEAESSETKTWLEHIDGLDYSARLLIGFFLLQAVQSATDKSAEWVALASAAGAEEAAESPLVRFVINEQDLIARASEEETARRRIEDRISRLEGFAEAATKLAHGLRRSLKPSAPPAKRK